MGVRNDWHVNGAAGLVAALEKGATQTPLLMAAVVDKTAVDLNALTQQNASGRPGPNAPTGDYRGSWRVEPVRDGVDEVSRSVGTDRPQARRLEYGFVGTDSLGRTYDQAPLPHHGPAVDVIEPQWEAAMAAVARQATTW
jgi:hypothetical protein